MTMYGIFFQNLSSIISEKCIVTANFLYGLQQPLLRRAFPT